MVYHCGALTARRIWRGALRLIARGITNQEIAQELVVSVDTVKSHVRAILDKLQASSKREAMAWARAQGIA